MEEPNGNKALPSRFRVATQDSAPLQDRTNSNDWHECLERSRNCPHLPVSTLASSIQQLIADANSAHPGVHIAVCLLRDDPQQHIAEIYEAQGQKTIDLRKTSAPLTEVLSFSSSSQNDSCSCCSSDEPSIAIAEIRSLGRDRGRIYCQRGHNSKPKNSSLPELAHEIASVVQLWLERIAHQKTEALLAHQVHFESIVSNLSSRFISLPYEQLDEGIELALREIGQFAQVDRSYTILFSEDGNTMSNTHEWCAPNVASQKLNLQELSTKAFDWFVRQIQDFETVVIENTKELPEEALVEKMEFLAEGIQSLVCVPIVMEGRAVGFLGLDSVNQHSTWAHKNIALLKVASFMFANAFERKLNDRERIARELDQQREFLRQVIDINPHLIFAKDRKGRFTLVNHAVAEIYGAPPSEIIGKTDADFSASPDEVEHFSVDDLEVINTLQEKCIIEECITDWRGEKHWLQTIKRPIVNEFGVSDQVLGVSTDITDWKRAEEERRQLETKMQQTQKLESLGVLAGGIAHDFNNLLMGVMGNTSLALIELENSPSRSRIEQIQTAALRASELTNQLLAYSGKGRFVVRKISLNEMFLEMLALLKTIISKRAQIHQKLSHRLPTIDGDSAQIRQVIMNLIMNASDALGENQGDIFIETGECQLSEKYLANCDLPHNVCPGRFVFLRVYDNGCGMSPETRKRIFDPFFSTKMTGRGLGLAAVLGIVRGHNGILDVETTSGEGTSFTIYLPISSTHPVTVDKGEAASGNLSVGPSISSGAILIIDDDSAILDVASAMLERLGYRTLTCSSGTDGIEVFRNRSDEILGVILDLTMPEIDGDEVFRILQEIDDRVPIILSSGYSENETNSRIQQTQHLHFLQKPYNLQQLSLAMKQLLKRRSIASNEYDPGI